MRARARVGAWAASLPGWLERAVLAVVFWQAAGLAWWVLAPWGAEPMLRLPRLPPAQADSREALVGWFSREAGAVEAAAGEYSLMAVIAGRDGAALFKGGDGKGIAVRTGDLLDASSRLMAVEPDGATLERDGVRQDLKLPQAEPRPIFSKAGGGGAVPPPAAKAGAPKAIRLTHGRMVAVMRGGNVAGWDKGLSSAPDGGIRIDRAAEQPFAGLLQLQDGDVLKKINRRPLERVADVSLIFFHFGQTPSVDLELIRRGVPLVQHYDIQP